MAAVSCCLSRPMAGMWRVEERGVRMWSVVQVGCSCVLWTYFWDKLVTPGFFLKTWVSNPSTDLWVKNPKLYNHEGHDQVKYFMWGFISFNGPERNLVEMFRSHECLYHNQLLTQNYVKQNNQTVSENLIRACFAKGQYSLTCTIKEVQTFFL